MIKIANVLQKMFEAQMKRLAESQQRQRISRNIPATVPQLPVEYLERAILDAVGRTGSGGDTYVRPFFQQGLDDAAGGSGLSLQEKLDAIERVRRSTIRAGIDATRDWRDVRKLERNSPSPWRSDRVTTPLQTVNSFLNSSNVPEPRINIASMGPSLFEDAVKAGPHGKLQLPLEAHQIRDTKLRRIPAELSEAKQDLVDRFNRLFPTAEPVGPNSLLSQAPPDSVHGRAAAIRANQERMFNEQRRYFEEMEQRRPSRLSLSGLLSGLSKFRRR